MAILPCFHIGCLGFGACYKATQVRSRQQFNGARSSMVRLLSFLFCPALSTPGEKREDPNTSITACCSFSQKGDVTCPTLCILRWDLWKGIKQWSVLLIMVFPRAASCLGSYRLPSSGSLWAISSHVQAMLCEQRGELGIQKHSECCEGNHLNSIDNMRWFLQGCEKFGKNNNR